MDMLVRDAMPRELTLSAIDKMKKLEVACRKIPGVQYNTIEQVKEAIAMLELADIACRRALYEIGRDVPETDLDSEERWKDGGLFL